MTLRLVEPDTEPEEQLDTRGHIERALESLLVLERSPDIPRHAQQACGALVDALEVHAQILGKREG